MGSAGRLAHKIVDQALYDRACRHMYESWALDMLRERNPALWSGAVLEQNRRRDLLAFRIRALYGLAVRKPEHFRITDMSVS